MTTPGRGLTPGTITPHPLAALLPGLFRDDTFALRMCAGLDDVLAPTLVSLDCLDAYFDPALTPPDFLDWLAGWVGLSLDQNWSDAQRRTLVKRAVELYRSQGTVGGIIDHVWLYTGVTPDVTDSGGTTWSSTPNGPLPGSPVADLQVRVTLPNDPPEGLHLGTADIDAIVAAAKPAHVPHHVEVAQAHE